MPAEAALALPAIRVCVDAARAAAYARETGLPAASGATPLAYPAVWLTTPPIYDAVQKICDETDSVPVHEQQRFVYEAPLRLGQDYDLHVAMRREEAPPRLNVEARITTAAGAPIARIETKLRLVPRASLGKGRVA